MADAPYIGAIGFMAMTGRVAPAGEVDKEQTREGIDGQEYIAIGKRGQMSMLTTMRDFDTAANAQAHINSCVALQGGNAVTVGYKDGTTLTNVQILRVVPRPVRRTDTPVGGLTAGDNLAVIDWHVQHTGVT